MTTREANEILLGDLNLVMNDAEELFRATASETGEQVKEVRRRLSAALELAQADCRRYQENAVEAARTTDHTIREHPYESIGVAFGMGLLVGVLVGRR